MENSIAILPIVFEEQRLPLFAFFLDAAAKIVSVPDSTFEWFWRFCDPATPRKEERSEVIIAHAEILAARLRAMTGFEREIDCCIRMQYPQADAAAMRLDLKQARIQRAMAPQGIFRNFRRRNLVARHQNLFCRPPIRSSVVILRCHDCFEPFFRPE